MEDIPLYNAWGEFVQSEIQDGISTALGPEGKVEMFLKVPSQSRVKALDSLLNKAFHRGKPYADPYDEITDKVGLRFVALLEKDVKLICSIIESSDSWVFSKDRDYLTERHDQPTVFDYQSVHYIVRAKIDISMGELVIPKNLPCEIQVRTLLQHAYSELTHDTIYKSLHEADSQTQRIVAKSMALIETADELFTRADTQIQLSAGSSKRWLHILKGVYDSKISVVEHLDEKLNAYLLDQILVPFDELSADSLADKLEEPDNYFIYEKIAQRYEQSSIFRQPISILVYFLARHSHRTLKKVWPLTPAELEPFLVDMGKAR